MACRKLIIPRILTNSSIRLMSSSDCPPPAEPPRKDITEVTHTGQVFGEKDYRNVRFVNATRYVNENWGMKLIDEIPPMECTERVVCCDGGDEHLGHPKVYINLDKPGAHACGYCGLRFVKVAGHH